jgi:plastocyanin
MIAKDEKDILQETEVKQERWFTRQPSSALNKLAFWMYLIGTIAGIGGGVAIGITSGAPSPDIILATVTSFICTVLVATRMRWMQVLSLIVGCYSLYQILTQPYVISSVLAPKTDPSGGFGHFVGVVVLAMCTMLAVFANLGVVLQNYRQGSRQTPRWLLSVLSGIVGIALGMLLLGAIVQPAVTTGTLYTNGVPTVHMGASSFLQASVTIPKGSKLLLVDDVSAVHIIANGTWQNGTVADTNEAGSPGVNNVQVNSGSVEIGPFATAGTYHIYCKVHQGMNLTVIVQ